MLSAIEDWQLRITCQRLGDLPQNERGWALGLYRPLSPIDTIEVEQNLLKVDITVDDVYPLVTVNFLVISMLEVYMNFQKQTKGGPNGQKN